MAAFYVYAPYTGTFNSRWNDACTYGSDYCPTPCHPAAWGTRPADIGAGAGQEISFWTSPTIGSSTYPVLSIVVSSLSGGVCLNTSIPLPWDGGMKVEMRSGFNGAGALLGTVYFAHVQNVASGAFNTINGGVTYIGYVPSSCPSVPVTAPTAQIARRVSVIAVTTFTLSGPGTRYITPVSRAATR